MELKLCLATVTTENIALAEVILAALFLLVSLIFFGLTLHFYRREERKKRWQESEEEERRLKKEYGRKDRKTDGYKEYIPDEDNTIAADPEWGETVISLRDGGDGETEVMESGEPVYLEYMEAGKRKRFFITREITRIGRQKDQVDLPVENNKVGKVHAQLIQENGKFYIRDLNSKNGTYINGSSRRIAEDILQPVYDGDQITFADSEFVFRCGWKD